MNLTGSRYRQTLNCAAIPGGHFPGVMYNIEWMQYSVVVKTPDSQSGNLGSIPGAPTGQPSRSYLRGQQIGSNCRQWLTTVEDRERECVRLYDGLNVAYAACGEINTAGFLQLYVLLEIDFSILRR